MSTLDEHSADRLRREREWHARTIAPRVAVQAISEATIRRYAACKNWRLFPKEFVFHALDPLKGKCVLDVGCGDGTVAIEMARLGAWVDAFDLSPELIALAQARAQASGVAERIRFRVEDAEAFEPDAQYDAAVILDLLHHCESCRRCWRASRQRWRPAGRWVIKEPVCLSRSLAKLRRWVPISTEASPDELPLTRQQLAQVSAGFGQSSVTPFRVLARFDRLLCVQKPDRRATPRHALGPARTLRARQGTAAPAAEDDLPLRRSGGGLHGVSPAGPAGSRSVPGPAPGERAQRPGAGAARPDRRG